MNIMLLDKLMIGLSAMTVGLFMDIAGLLWDLVNVFHMGTLIIAGAIVYIGVVIYIELRKYEKQ